MFNHSRYDVLVVGARCAGAATAMLMARSGLRVLVIDRGRYASDTTSTHALMRGGVMQLHRWGLLPRIVAAGTPAVRSTEFHYGEDVVQVEIRPQHGVEALVAPRRTLLDSTLVDAARAAGAEVRHGCTLAALLRRTDGRVCGAAILDGDGQTVEVMADLVVGADGIGSTVARLAGARVLWEGRHATAVVYGHCRGLRAAAYSWYYREQIGAGVIPTNGGAHCVFVAVPPARFRDEIRHDIAAGFSRALGDAFGVTGGRCRVGQVRSGTFGVRGPPRLASRGLGAWLGAGRRRRLLQGSADRTRHDRCITGCGTAGGRSRAGFGERIRRLCGAARGAVAGAVRDHRCHRFVCLGSRHPAAMAPRTEHSNEARGRVSGGPFPARHRILAGEGSMTDTSSTTGIAVTTWARTIKGRPAIGGFAERSRRTGMADVAMFTEMTGDRNPLHYDAALAAGSPFGGLIVQGGVTSGLLNAVVAEDLPGPGSVFLGVEWRFVKAVHVGEEITARVEVVTVRDDKPICTMATTVRNARGEVCLSGSAVTYTVPLRAGGAG